LTQTCWTGRIAASLARLPTSRWRALPLVLAAAGILGSMACVRKVPIITLPAHDDLAVTQLLPSAETGNAVDQYRLAVCYRIGVAGVAKDLAASWKWLSRSAQSRHEPALTDQADAWLYGDYGQTQDVAAGLAAWRALAAQGSVNAPVHWANRLLDERQPWADKAEAARWLEAAARRGRRSAGYKLAQLLEAGVRKPPVDVVEVAAWYRWGRASSDYERLEAQLSERQRQQAEARWLALEKEIAP
jgi:TPR repeat protein